MRRAVDQKVVGVIGAITGLAVLAPAAQAAQVAAPTSDLTNPRSFAELLAPIPNAVAALRAADALAAGSTQTEALGAANGETQVAGVRHHHHHHHKPRKPPRRHHHHHHHHLSFT